MKGRPLTDAEATAAATWCTCRVPMPARHAFTVRYGEEVPKCLECRQPIKKETKR